MIVFGTLIAAILALSTGSTLRFRPEQMDVAVMHQTEVNDVVCPGGHQHCPTGFTCCQLQSGQYGCCPYPKATCCSDKRHCCPHGYQCDLVHMRCVHHGNDDITSISEVQVSPVPVNDVVCPGGQQHCPTGFTCCQLQSGQYGCCPYPKATCCSDKRHCCPHGYQCDLVHMRCVHHGNDDITSISEVQVSPVQVNDVVCPGGQQHCPTGFTCCQLQSGQYGCCPYPKATCCSDKRHCCPHGYQCDLVHMRCVHHGNDDITSISEVQVSPVQVNDVVCPGGHQHCPTGFTCCQLQSGQYGCCPYPKATCCSDKRHCCPHGYQCDLVHMRCVHHGKDIMPLLEKTPAIMEVDTGLVPANDVPCPGGHQHCPSHETCCLLQSGQYGCCPYEGATCCSDHLHCCPHGYRCDLTHQECVMGADTASMLKKTASLSWLSNGIYNLKDVVCPGGQQHCPTGFTCCQLQSGQYGCCPYPKATCCSDKRHCCPHGYQCDLVHMRCVHHGNDDVTSISEVQVSLVRVNDVVCPGGQQHCPTGFTCCQLQSGQYGCCPYPKATCCSDKRHCCPHGYQCDLVHMRCVHHGNDDVTSISEVQVSLVPANDVVCPGGHQHCPTGFTCCQLQSGQYGCCPYPKATCCSDKRHCCPHGYQCDLVHMRCVHHGSDVMPLLEKTPAILEVDANLVEEN